jgi:hypothetical protein
MAEQRLLQQNAEVLFSDLLAQEAEIANDEGDSVWDIINGLMGGRRMDPWHQFPQPFMNDHLWSDEEDDEDYQDEEDEDDDYFDDDYFGDVPDLVSEDDLPDLLSDGLPEDLPDLVDDSLPDDLPDLVSDDDIGVSAAPTATVDEDLPDLVSDDDNLPDLLSDDDCEQPISRTRPDWGPTNAQSDILNRHPQVALSGPTPSSTRPDWGPTNAIQDTQNRPRVNLHPTPQVPHVSHRLFQHTPLQSVNVYGQSTHPQPQSPTHRRFSPPQHTPPPGRRRPRPPRTRNRDTSRPRAIPHPTLHNDEITWDDVENITTEAESEHSERERQSTRDREERGINARNWDSRASDLSFFLS